MRAVLLQILDEARCGLHCLPVNAIGAGDHQAGIQDFGAGEHACQQICHGRIVGVVLHGGADVGIEIFFLSQLIEAAEEGHGVGVSGAKNDLGERLRSDADGFNLESGGFVCGLGSADEAERLSDLLAIVLPVEAHKGGDGADFGAPCGGTRSGGLLHGSRRSRLLS